MPSRVTRISRILQAEQEERRRNELALRRNPHERDPARLVPYRNTHFLEMCCYVESMLTAAGVQDGRPRWPTVTY